MKIETDVATELVKDALVLLIAKKDLVTGGVAAFRRAGLGPGLGRLGLSCLPGGACRDSLASQRPPGRRGQQNGQPSGPTAAGKTAITRHA